MKILSVDNSFFQFFNSLDGIRLIKNGFNNVFAAAVAFCCSSNSKRLIILEELSAKVGKSVEKRTLHLVER